MCLTRQRDYDATPGAVGAARDFVSALVVASLAPRGWPVADDAALAVSELASAAVETGCTRLVVRADVHADRLCVAVIGSGQAPPEGTSGAQLSGLRGTVLDQVVNSADLRHAPDGTLRGVAELPCRSEWTAAVPCDERR